MKTRAGQGTSGALTDVCKADHVDTIEEKLKPPLDVKMPRLHQMWNVSRHLPHGAGRQGTVEGAEG